MFKPSKALFIVFVAVIALLGLLVWLRPAQAPVDTLQSNGTVTSIVSNVSSSIYNPTRITKKPFGIYITPANSPVQPEKFTGYHTGTDFETTSAEANIDVPILAFCDGKLLLKKYASGYGGVAVQSCTLNGQAVTIIYGHLKLASIAPVVGQSLKKGDFISLLGRGFSTETDGERKHLHLGIHIGSSVNILGYVQKQSDLSGWLDPAQFLR